ncbi:hypothetical protein BT69DRAFT_1275820 [Atractiella rhizophila]|nr:hypothetical protein BT69DRAFT_1275820 [Atractiella rhizophila]
MTMSMDVEGHWFLGLWTIFSFVIHRSMDLNLEWTTKDGLRGLLKKPEINVVWRSQQSMNVTNYNQFDTLLYSFLLMLLPPLSRLSSLD